MTFCVWDMCCDGELMAVCGICTEVWRIRAVVTDFLGAEVDAGERLSASGPDLRETGVVSAQWPQFSVSARRRRLWRGKDTLHAQHLPLVRSADEHVRTPTGNPPMSQSQGNPTHGPCVWVSQLSQCLLWIC